MRAAHCLCVAKPPSFMTPMRPKSKDQKIVPPMQKGMKKMERWALLRKILKPLLLEITENDKEADMCTIFIFKEYVVCSSVRIYIVSHTQTHTRTQVHRRESGTFRDGCTMEMVTDLQASLGDSDETTCCTLETYFNRMS